MSDRKKHQFGKSQINDSDLRGIRQAWNERRLALFLGAGLSADYGIPSWKNLVLALLFEQTNAAQHMKSFGPHYKRALASWMADHFEYNPVILARVVKNAIAKRATRKGLSRTEAQRIFIDAVQRHLYHENPRLTTSAPRKPTTLTAVADLIARGAAEGRIPAVITFNFDDLLERELRKRHVKYYCRWTVRRTLADGLPIIHPHGFLPREDAPQNCDLVFTEDDYHSLTHSVFHWALTEVVIHLRHHHVLFIGLSMSDPNLRRLLDASYVYGDIPAHWQLQKRHKVGKEEQPEVMSDIAERARRFGALLGIDESKDPVQLVAAVDAVLRQADTYDRELFQAMGVKTIWLEDYADIPRLLKGISE